MHNSSLPKFLWPEAVLQAVYVRNRTWNRALSDHTPYELLTGWKLNVHNLQPWECKVRVHDTDRTKLEGWSKVVHWMGFDPDTKDGHQIYWPKKWLVTVERSIRYNFNDSDDANVRILPIEGKISTNTTNKTVTADKLIETKYRNSDVADSEVTVVNLKPDSGWGKWVQKKSKYIWMLKDGTAMTGQKSILPRGMWQISQLTPTMDEHVEVDIEHAMASIIKNTDRIMPGPLTFHLSVVARSRHILRNFEKRMWSNPDKITKNLQNDVVNMWTDSIKASKVVV